MKGTTSTMSLILAVLLMASSVFSASTNRIKRDKATGHHHQHHQDVGRPGAGYRYGPHAPLSARTAIRLPHPGALTTTATQLRQYRATGPTLTHHHRRPPPLDNYRLLPAPPHAPAGAQQNYVQQPRPQTLPVPLPVQLTPAGVVLPSLPKNPSNGGYLSGSASAQTAYLGPFRQPTAGQPFPAPQQVRPVQPPPLHARQPVQQQLAVNPVQPVAPIQPPPVYARDPAGVQQQAVAPAQSQVAIVQQAVAPVQPPPIYAREPQPGPVPSLSNPVQQQSVAPIQPPPVYAREPQTGPSQPVSNEIQQESVAPIQPPPIYAREPQSGVAQSVGNQIPQQVAVPAQLPAVDLSNVAPLQPPPLYAREPQPGTPQVLSNDIHQQQSVPAIQPPPLIARDPQSGLSESVSNDVQQQNVVEPAVAVDLTNVAPLQPPPLYARDPISQEQPDQSSHLTNDIHLSETQHQSSFPSSGSAEPLQPPPLYARQPTEAQQSVQQSVAGPTDPLQPPPLYARQPSSSADLGFEQTAEDQSGRYAPAAPITVPPVSISGGANDDSNTGSFALPPPLPPPSEVDSNSNALADVNIGAGGSGSSNSISTGDSQWSEGSIPWQLEKLGFNTLNDLLVLSGQDEALDKEGPFTVFVPVDKAFEILIAKLGGMEKATAEFDKNPEVLTSLLKHHVLPGTILSSSLQDNSVSQSLLGTPLRVKFYESEDSEWRPLKVITVNGARILRPDIQATNGVIHIIDRVLFPVPQADIYSTLKADPQQRYTTLVAAIEKAGLTSALADPAGGPYTVFAPTDKAFSLISRSELNGMLNDPARLAKLLQRHVVQDLIYTSGLQGFQKAYTLDFELIYIYHAKGMTKVNGANVVDQDATALNGVIHTIDSVLGIN